MSMTATMLNVVDYGAAELKRFYQRNARMAFTYSAVAHLLAGAIYLGVEWYVKEEKALSVRIVKYSDLGPPPSMTDQAAAPQIQVSAAPPPPSTIATQTEMSQMTSLIGGEGGFGEGSVIQVEEPVVQSENIVVEQEELPQMGEFVPREEDPVAVDLPKPVYPEIARRAGIEGVVFIQILIDRTGKVRDVQVTKGPEMFYEAAREAAWRSVWRPAIQNKKPVAVWVAMPIRFMLR